MPFTLKKETTEYQFDTDGRVISGGAAAGTWSVDGNNRISLKPPTGSAVTFDVDWSFINNQLCLVVGGEKTFNFHSAGFPDYRVVANRIQVSPRTPASPFAFTLTAELSLNEQLDLLVKIGKTQSVLSGALEDTQGQFIYRFKDAVLGQQDALIFAGEWKRDDNVEGELRLSFVYAVAGASRTIAIPRAFDVDPFTNSLRLSYEKEGQSRLLKLAGEIQFKNNTTIVFSVRKSASNGKSEIELNFRLNGTGKTVKTLEILILKKDGTDGSKILEIGGTLSAKVGSAGVTIGFRYAKTSGGAASKTIDIAVNGRFSLKNGELTFTYKKTGTSQAFSIVAQDFQFGAVTVGGGITVENGSTVRAFIGLQW